LLVRWPAGCVCRDGAVWLFWWQSLQNPDQAHADQAVPEDCGIFCRLFSADGQDILPPRRIIVPDNYVHATLDISTG